MLSGRKKVARCHGVCSNSLLRKREEYTLVCFRNLEFVINTAGRWYFDGLDDTTGLNNNRKHERKFILQSITNYRDIRWQVECTGENFNNKAPCAGRTGSPASFSKEIVLSFFGLTALQNFLRSLDNRFGKVTVIKRFLASQMAMVYSSSAVYLPTIGHVT